MTETMRIREAAEVNPPVPEFDNAPPDAAITFVPLEAVWPGSRLDLSRVRPKAEVATGYVRFREGDILVPKVTPTFQAARSVRALGVPTIIGAASTEVHTVRVRPESDPRYVMYAFHTERFLGEGVSAFQGVAGLQRVPDAFVRDFRVRRRALPEQQRIADFLDDQVARIDEIIRLREEELGLLGERRVELLRRTTSIGDRLSATRATGIAWMPTVAEGWRLAKISTVFQTGSGTTPRSDEASYFDGETPWINTGDLRDAVVTETRKYVSQQALDDYSALRIFEPETLVVAMYGATIGRVGLVPFSACVNQACCVLRPISQVATEWAFYWFVAQRQEIVRLAYGGGQPNISQDTIRALRIPVPPAAEQARLVALMEEHDESVNQTTKSITGSISLLHQRKRSLITAAVTGEFDVSTASGRGVA